MEKEEMEEELAEKMEVLQRELGQARAGAGDTRQVEELRKVLGSWGAIGQVGVMGICLTYPRGPPHVCGCLPCAWFSGFILPAQPYLFPAHTRAGLVSSFSIEVSNGKGSR